MSDYYAIVRSGAAGMAKGMVDNIPYVGFATDVASNVWYQKNRAARKKRK